MPESARTGRFSCKINRLSGKMSSVPEWTMQQTGRDESEHSHSAAIILPEWQRPSAPFFRGLCPGLIEVTPPYHGTYPSSAGFSGVYAPASLKYHYIRGRDTLSSLFFRGLCPGLIEVQYPSFVGCILECKFFRGLCPGLIEGPGSAGSRRPSRRFSGVYAPASLKVPPRAQDSGGRRGFSGVYAPASLKGAWGLRGVRGGRSFSGVYAPASLKARLSQ